MTQKNQLTLNQAEKNEFINVLKSLYIYPPNLNDLVISYGTSPKEYNKIYLEYRANFTLPNHDKFYMHFYFTFIIPDTLFSGNNKLSSVSSIDPIPGFKLFKSHGNFEVQINDLYTQAFVNDAYKLICNSIIHNYYNPLIPKLINERNKLIDQNNFTLDNYLNVISKII